MLNRMKSQSLFYRLRWLKFLQKLLSKHKEPPFAMFLKKSQLQMLTSTDFSTEKINESSSVEALNQNHNISRRTTSQGNGHGLIALKKKSEVHKTQCDRWKD